MKIKFTVVINNFLIPQSQYHDNNKFVMATFFCYIIFQNMRYYWDWISNLALKRLYFQIEHNPPLIFKGMEIKHSNIPYIFFIVRFRLKPEFKKHLCVRKGNKNNTLEETTRIHFMIQIPILVFQLYILDIHDSCFCLYSLLVFSLSPNLKNSQQSKERGSKIGCYYSFLFLFKQTSLLIVCF